MELMSQSGSSLVYTAVFYCSIPLQRRPPLAPSGGTLWSSVTLQTVKTHRRV